MYIICATDVLLLFNTNTICVVVIYANISTPIIVVVVVV